MNHAHNRTADIETPISQYVEFKATCLKCGVAPAEISVLWHTYQLSRTTREINRIYHPITDLNKTMGGSNHPMPYMAQALDRIATELEHR